MFETEDFRKKIADAISREVGRENYQPSIVDYLQKLAAGNEKSLMESEMRKSVGDRRGVHTALESVHVLVMEARSYQLPRPGEKLNLLRLVDIEAAYKAKFCQVWPFCK
jgi:hypothetical protein